MISPTIGRVVWFWSSANEDNRPCAALVAYVHSDTMINVGGFDHNGAPVSQTSVQLIQGDEVPKGPHCRWMPFQKGQAAKNEVLEAQMQASFDATRATT
jgi:hypothetical protein